MLVNNNTLVLGKSIGNGKGHRLGCGESYFIGKDGNGKVLALSNMVSPGFEKLPEPKVVLVENKEKPILYFMQVGSTVIAD